MGEDVQSLTETSGEGTVVTSLDDLIDVSDCNGFVASPSQRVGEEKQKQHKYIHKRARCQIWGDGAERCVLCHGLHSDRATWWGVETKNLRRVEQT